MGSARRGPALNRLLQALPRGERERMLEGGETIDLCVGDVLQAPGERLRDVYFPLAGFVSLMLPVDADACLEVGLVGAEGMLGVQLLLDVDVSPVRAIVQGAGRAVRVDAARFRTELAHSPALRTAIGRYACVRMAQLAQTSACTRFHVVEARLARWLLMTQDRARSGTFHVTHELLASMLGVRRVGITRAATALQNRRLIHYSRGDVTIVDRAGLKASSCGCYLTDRRSYDRLLGRNGARS